MLTLTLAIGVGAAAFGTLSGVLTRPAPGVPADPALVAIRGLQTSNGRLIGRAFSYPELMEYARVHELVDVAGFSDAQVAVEMPGSPPGRPRPTSSRRTTSARSACAYLLEPGRGRWSRCFSGMDFG